MRDLLRRAVGRTEGLLLLVILLFGAILSLSSPYFLTLQNVVDLVEGYSVTAILALSREEARTLARAAPRRRCRSRRRPRS